MKSYPPETVEAMFWSRVKLNLLNGCWEWQNARSLGRYGYVSAGKKHLAHRLSYEWAFGPIPEGKVVMHECDNPPCVNPNHLRLGTLSQNAKDMVQKGRHSPGKGERHKSATLTAAKVRAIRERYAGQQRKSRFFSNAGKLALEYGVSLDAVRAVVSGKTWKHVR